MIMKLAIVFSACVALAWARFPGTHSMLVPTPWTSATEIPVNVAHDFIRTFGFVKPSDEEIINYVNSIGITDTDVTPALRSLYTDPAMVLMEDDHDKVVAYYADTGMHFMNAYPETRATFNSLLDASNAVALVYKPERFLHPSERKHVASRFFSPANFRIHNIEHGYPESVSVVDAPVVLKKLAFPTNYARGLGHYHVFDIEKIPYAYKSPVYLRLSDTASPVWNKAIDSDVYPSHVDYVTYPTAKPMYYIPSDEIAHYARYSYCHKKPWLCKGMTTVAPSIDIPSLALKTLPYMPEASWPFHRVLDSSYPIVKPHLVPLETVGKEYLDKIPVYSDDMEKITIPPTADYRWLKTISPSVPISSNPAVALATSKSVPYVKSPIINVPSMDNFVTKMYPTIDTPAEYIMKESTVPPFLIRPEHLKAATVPVLSVVEPELTASTPIINNPISPIFSTSVF